MILIYLIPVSGHSFDLWRGVKDGASCQQIIEIEKRLGSEIISKDRSSLVGFKGKHGSSDAVIIYSCIPDHWFQSIDYGRLERESAISELNLLTDDIENKYGKPSLDLTSLSLWDRLIAFVEYSYFDTKFYYEFTSIKMWKNDEQEVTAFISQPSILLDNSSDLWSVSYSRSPYNNIFICDKIDCKNAGKFESVK
jgi:hypothetical protein